MPLHDFECPAGHVFDAVVPAGCDSVLCVLHQHEAQKVFLRAPAGFVSADIHYDSPIDGRVINSKHARIEDLRRNECVEYEPGMRQDHERRLRDSDKQLDAVVDRSVDEFFATAGSRKLEKLESELNAGASVEVQRASPATS